MTVNETSGFSVLNIKLRNPIMYVFLCAEVIIDLVKYKSMLLIESRQYKISSKLKHEVFALFPAQEKLVPLLKTLRIARRRSSSDLADLRVEELAELLPPICENSESHITGIKPH